MEVHAQTLDEILLRWCLTFLPDYAKRCDPEDCMSGEEDRQLEHVAYMVDEIGKFARAHRHDKAMRWFCWAQGVLWANGYLTLDECRVDVYRILNGGEQPPASDDVAEEVAALNSLSLQSKTGRGVQGVE